MIRDDRTERNSGDGSERIRRVEEAQHGGSRVPHVLDPKFESLQTAHHSAVDLLARRWDENEPYLLVETTGGLNENTERKEAKVQPAEVGFVPPFHIVFLDDPFDETLLHEDDSGRHG